MGFFAASTIAKSKSPVSLVPKCGACRLFEGCRSPKMPWTGEGRRRVLIVAEAPGKEEDRQNTQLVGKAGQCLRRVLRDIGISLDRDCWKTNAIICRPPGNATPTDDQVTWCRPNLLNTIAELQPEIIIPLGGTAVSSLIGHLWRENTGGIGTWAGFRIPEQSLNAWICPTFHPSYIDRLKADDVAHLFFRRHLEAAFDLEGRPWDVVPDYEKEVRIVADPTDAARLIRKIAAREGGMAAFDYEGNMLKPDGRDFFAASCAITWGRDRPEITIAYPWHGDAIEATGEFVRSPIPKIASNCKFEDRWSRVLFGHRVRNWYWDTMVDGHILDQRPDITGLKFQSFIRLGVASYDDHIKPFLKSKTKGAGARNEILRDVELRELLTYNGLDAILEWLVAQDQMREMSYPFPWES